MKGTQMSVIFRLITMFLFLFMSASCAVPSQSLMQDRLDVKKTGIQEGLNSCMGKLTKSDLAMKASSPTERLPVNGGEVWVYKYQLRTGAGYPVAMEVRVNFGANGIMNNFIATGQMGEFETPFEHLRCENLQRAIPNSGNNPAAGNAAGGYLGVRFQPMTEELAEASGLHKIKGAFVLIAIKNSPAEQAGLKSGDIILSFDGKEINGANELSPLVAATPLGKTVEVRFYRDGQERAARVRLGNLPGAGPKPENEPEPGTSAGAAPIDDWLTTEEGAKVWLLGSESGDTAKWSGGRDAEKFASGPGTLQRFNKGKLHSSYEGTLKKGKGEGSARFRDAAGTTYEGNYADGVRNGKGTMRWPDGRIYNGDWKNNDIEGKGVMKRPNGIVYEGDFVQNVAHGKGILRMPDGTTHDGDFVNGQPDGKGLLKTPDGRVYEGDFLKGARTGKGVLRFPNGSRYEGDFLDGKFDGNGTIYGPDGKILTQGKFKDDKVISAAAGTFE
jgi:hypothetical protein